MSVITGTASDDTLVGGVDADDIDGLQANDLLQGLDGDDTLWLTVALYDDARTRARRIVERTRSGRDHGAPRRTRISVRNITK